MTTFFFFIEDNVDKEVDYSFSYNDKNNKKVHWTKFGPQNLLMDSNMQLHKYLHISYSECLPPPVNIWFENWIHVTRERFLIP
jgi:hypothetical protein